MSEVMNVGVMDVGQSKKLALLALFETLKFTQNVSFLSCSSEKSHSSYAYPFFYPSLFWARNIADYLCNANDQEKENHLWTSLNECPLPIV